METKKESEEQMKAIENERKEYTDKIVKKHNLLRKRDEHLSCVKNDKSGKDPCIRCPVLQQSGLCGDCEFYLEIPF